MMGLRRIGRKTICQGEIVDLCSDTVVLPDGKAFESVYPAFPLLKIDRI